MPDFRGVYPKGAGTTNRVAGKDANGNYYAGVLGTYTTDKTQGHWHNSVNHATSQVQSGTSYVLYGIRVKTSSQTENSTQWGSGSPTSDGTNGTPRTGLTTEPQSLGITFMIKY